MHCWYQQCTFFLKNKKWFKFGCTVDYNSAHLSLEIFQN